MARILVGFLMIFLITKETSSFDLFGIDFEDLKTIYNYVTEYYQKAEALQETSTLHGKNEAVQLHDIMRDLKTLSREVINIQTNQNVKFDSIVKVLLDDIEISGDLRAVKTELLHQIDHVEYLYNQSMVYDTSGSFDSDTLKGFYKAVLFGVNNLPETMYNIHMLIFPGSNSLLRNSFQTLSLSYVGVNYERLCNRGISEQQRMFYIFTMIIQTHLKAFATITQAYSIRLTFNNAQHPQEYKTLLLKFHTQLTEYLKEFFEIIRYFPGYVRQCDPSQPKIGTDVVEFEGLFQVVVATEFDLRRKFHISYPWLGWTQGSCEDIKSTRLEQLVVYDCETIDSIQGCPVTRSRQARYSWWKTASATYGHPYDCPNSLVDVVNEQDAFTYNDVCTCSVGFTPGPLYLFPPGRNPLELENPKIRWFSIEPQMSDVANNMVVVGVRFILHDSAVHLQIKQSKLWSGVNQTHGEWKPVDRDNNNKTISIKYSGIDGYRAMMHLDDIGVDPRYVVTGVRLQLNKKRDGYELNVHGTEYIHENNQLGTSQMWYKPGDYPINPLEYQRERTEIHLNDPDDPTTITVYHPDPGANKFVKFQHTSVQKDGGYHTVPLFDAQPVAVTMHSPLGGIGLFYRGYDGFGGYIAPRLFTFNVTNILETSITKWMEFDRSFKYCYNQESDPEVSNLPAECAKLGMNTQRIKKDVRSLVKIGSQNMPTSAVGDTSTMSGSLQGLSRVTSHISVTGTDSCASSPKGKGQLKELLRSNSTILYSCSSYF